MGEQPRQDSDTLLVGEGDTCRSKALVRMRSNLFSGWDHGTGEETLAETTHFLTFHSKVIHMGI